MWIWGNIYHDALWHFAERIRRSSYTWYDLPEQTREAWIEESMNDAIAGCANVGAFDEAKNRHSLSRMKDTIRRTVWALTIQVQKGRFTPSDFEVSFFAGRSSGGNPFSADRGGKNASAGQD